MYQLFWSPPNVGYRVSGKLGFAHIGKEDFPKPVVFKEQMKTNKGSHVLIRRLFIQAAEEIAFGIKNLEDSLGCHRPCFQPKSKKKKKMKANNGFGSK